MIYIGMDDTDTLESRGTGNLARRVAAHFSSAFTVHGVVRHQLLKDPRVPCTSHNSSATIVMSGADEGGLAEIFDTVKKIMLDDFQDGSDPGLCVAAKVPDQVMEFGRLAQRSLVKQQAARDLARSHNLRLEGLGGTEDGVIGALASIGLSALGNDGRYVLVGSIREIKGLQPVDAVIAAGVEDVRTMDENSVTEGLIFTDKVRPARRGHRPIAYVEWTGDHWNPLKLD